MFGGREIAMRQEQQGFGTGRQRHVAVVPGDFSQHPGPVNQRRGLLQPSGGKVRLAPAAVDKRLKRRPVLLRNPGQGPIQARGRRSQLLACTSGIPWAACMARSSQPAARSGMPRWTDIAVLRDGRAYTPKIRSTEPWKAGNLPSEPYSVSGAW
jgi:hypothetical protein